MMRNIIQKLGRTNTVLIITVFSILVSVFLTSLILFIKQDFAGFDVLIPVAIIIPLVVAPLTSWPVMGLLLKVDRLEKKMRTLATYDVLTGLLSRRAFFHDAKSLIDSAEREKVFFSVIALDIDKFKLVNDNYGHAAGDEVLKHFATTTKSVIRKGDLIGRIGGEEFALLLPNSSEDMAYLLTERLHDAVRESVIVYEQIPIKYTVSMGLVSILPMKSDKIEDILKDADKSLYLAKETGRDRTVVFNASN